MSTTIDRVRELVEPIVRDLDATLYDVELSGGVLRISLERDAGLDMAVLTEATRRISAELDRDDPLPGRYTLEVSSPGLERPLRTETHFAGAVGELVKVKTRPGVEGDRRVEGELIDVADGVITVRNAHGEERRLALDEVERATTHVDWAPAPKPGKPGAAKQQKQKPTASSKTAQSPDRSNPRSEGTS